MLARVARQAAPVVAGLWAGEMLCIGALAAPSAFAILSTSEAGRLVGRLLAQDAYLSIGVGVVLLVVERQRDRASDACVVGSGTVFSANVLLLLGSLFCSVAGYFAVQPLMDAARAGQGRLSFAALHAVSAGMFALKALLVLALAWRLATIRRAATTS